MKGHFDLIVDQCNDKHHGKFVNIKLEKVFAAKAGHQDWFYWAHVNAGPHGEHFNWTVVFEVKGHKPTLEAIHEGHHTFF